MRILATLLLAATAAAQSVLPPFKGTLEIVNLGEVAGIFTYGGTAFVPGNPNVLLLAQYGSLQIQAVVVTRDGLGRINGFGAPTPVASAGGLDGGLAFGPGNVLFATSYTGNQIGQWEPGSTAPDRVDNLYALGASGNVGTCTFVPAGHPGAGRFKVCTWSNSAFYDVPLTPDGNGTYALGAFANPVQLINGPEGIVYAPFSMPLVGGQLLVATYNTSEIIAYQVDAIGDPLPATAQTVVAGASFPGGGTVDPVTGHVVFLADNGLLVLRPGSACGSYTHYGNPSPGALGTPTINGVGCANIGQSIHIAMNGPANGFGVLVFGTVPTIYYYFNIEVLVGFDADVTFGLDGTGFASLPLTIPNVPSLGWAHGYMQAAFLDPSTASGAIATRGLDITFR